MKNRITNKNNIKFMCGIGVFSALAIIVAFATHGIKVGFLSFDAKDAVITLAAFIYGPVSGVLIAAVAAIVEFFTFSSTGVYGLLMNFASSATIALVSSLIYSRKKTFRFAIFGIYTGVVSVTLVMLVLNILVTPHYMGVDVGDVVAMLPTILLPFNLAKALFNGGAVLLMYKPVIRAMRKANIAPAIRKKSAPGNSAPTDNTVVKSGQGTHNTSLAITLGLITVAVAVLALVLLQIFKPWKG